MKRFEKPLKRLRRLTATVIPKLKLGENEKLNFNTATAEGGFFAFCAKLSGTAFAFHQLSIRAATQAPGKLEISKTFLK